MSNATGIGTAIVPPNVGNQTISANTIFVLIEYVDIEGEVSAAKFYVTSPTPTNPIDFGELQDVASEYAVKHAALSNGQVRRVAVGREMYVTMNKPPNPATGDRNIEDKTWVEMQTAVGVRISTSVPASLRSTAVYLGDLETVDPSAGLPAALLTDFVTGYSSANGNTWYLSTPLGEPAQSYIKGYHKRAKTRRKLRQGISTEIGG